VAARSIARDYFILLTLSFRSKAVFKTKIIIYGFCFYVAFLPVAYATDIVVNQSVPESEYSLNKTRAIFTMRQRFWSNGEKIRVFTLVDKHSLHKSFTKNKLHMFPHQLRRVWDRMVFSGTGQAPTVVQTEEEMLGKIAITPNAIGYLSSRTENEKIRLFYYQ